MGEQRRGPGGAGALGGWRGANGGNAAPRRAQTVWIIEDPVSKKLKAVQIRAGITDGHFTEVVSGDLKVGDSVVVGLATSKVEGPPPPGSSNPMGGRQGPGGRGR